jgi:hypothetical protein
MVGSCRRSGGLTLHPCSQIERSPPDSDGGAALADAAGAHAIQTISPELKEVSCTWRRRRAKRRARDCSERRALYSPTSRRRGFSLIGFSASGQNMVTIATDAMPEYGRVAGLGALLSRQLGAKVHYANGLAALSIATGQDAACVSDSSVGFTRLERREGSLFASITPTQRPRRDGGRRQGSAEPIGGTGHPAPSRRRQIGAAAGDRGDSAPVR